MWTCDGLHSLTLTFYGWWSLPYRTCFYALVGGYSLWPYTKLFISRELVRLGTDKSIISSVYSSWEVGKLQCFEWIKARFNGPNVRFCVIGDGWEEGEAAQLMQWPFIKIDMRPGSSHRFPGLTLKTVGFYFSVVYGNSDAEDENE